MARFSLRPFRFLDNLFSFQDSAVPAEVDNTSPFQWVLDGSRSAAMGEAFGPEMGYFVQGVTNAHVAAGGLRKTADPWANIDPVQRANTCIWLLACFGQCTDASVFDEASAALVYPTVADAFAAESMALYRWPDAVVDIVSGEVALVDLARPSLDAELPLWVADGGHVAFFSAQAGAGATSVKMDALFWAGKKGTLPPGHG